MLKSLLSDLSPSHVVYYGDTARVPYGNKDAKTIIRFSLEALDFFSDFDLDLLVVACNTASARALSHMQEKTSLPIIGVIESGVRALLQRGVDKQANVLVIATQSTMLSGSYETALRHEGYTNVTTLATNLFVSLVEERIFSGPVVEAAFRHYFPPSLRPSVVILGCTHFPLLLDSLRGYFGPSTLFVHSGEAIAAFLQQNFSIQKGSPSLLEFHASDSVGALKAAAKLWLGDGDYRILSP